MKNVFISKLKKVISPMYSEVNGVSKVRETSHIVGRIACLMKLGVHIEYKTEFVFEEVEVDSRVVVRYE